MMLMGEGVQYIFLALFIGARLAPPSPRIALTIASTSPSSSLRARCQARRVEPTSLERTYGCAQHIVHPAPARRTMRPAVARAPHEHGRTH